MQEKATPLPTDNIITYFDNPSLSTDVLDGMSVEEVLVYIQGYVQACYWFAEILGDSKRRFISGALGEPENVQKKLMTYVSLLDEFEDKAEEKIENLKDLFNEAVVNKEEYQ